jgi:hypothetical protein
LSTLINQKRRQISIIIVGENIGTTETHALIVEIKPKKKDGMDCKDSTVTPPLEKAWKKNNSVDSRK